MLVACLGNIPRLLLLFFLSELTKPFSSSFGDVGFDGKLLSDISDVRDAVGVDEFSAIVKGTCCGDDGWDTGTFILKWKIMRT